MKKGVIIFSAILSVMLLASFVAAQISSTELGAPPQLPALQPGSFGAFIYDAFRTIFDVIGNILFNTATEGAFFTKILIFLLLFIVLTPAAKMAKLGGDNEKLQILVAFIVALMGARFLTDKLVNLILLPYGTLAIVISSMIPLFALFYFAETMGQAHAWMKKVTWILAAVSFVGLWFYRLSAVGAAANIYLITALICLFMLLYEKRMNIHSLVYGHYSTAILNLQMEIANLGLNQANAISAGDTALATAIEAQMKRKQTAIDILIKKRTPSWVGWSIWAVVILFALYVFYFISKSGGLGMTLSNMFNFG